MNDGGPAFPFSRQWENERKGYTEHEYGDGMTLRDYFAGQALATLAAGIIAADEGGDYTEPLETLARGAYRSR